LGYLKNEIKKLFGEIKSLSFKETFIFMAVAVITFVSMYYASPNFFRRVFDTSDDKFYATLYWFATDGFLMFILPIIIIKFIFKQKLSDYGFQKGDIKFGLITSVIFIAVMIPVIWIASGSEVFARTYPQGGVKIRENIEILLYYELFVGFYMLGWEFFWRGFILFGLKEKFGYYAVFIQLIPFVILHRGKPDIEAFASIFAGLLLGVQALRARSFIYCFIVHWGVMIFVDVISVLRYRNQAFGIGFDAFYNIIFK
jgi:hypothetical protein